MSALYPVFHSVITLGLVMGAFAFMGQRLLQIASMVNMGRHEAVRTDHKSARWRMVASIVFGHKKTLEDKTSGLTHMAFIYGFTVLGAGHSEIVVEGLTMFLRTFGTKPLTWDRLPLLSPEHPLIWLYWTSQDFAAFLVLTAVVIALVRRIAFAPPRLQPRSADAERILYFILFLYVTFYFFQGAHHLREHDYQYHYTQWKPFTSMMSMWMAHVPTSAVDSMYWIFWWGHVLIFLGFGAYIPTSKHMHLIFAGPNTWFFNKGTYAWRQPDVAAAEKKLPPKERARPMGLPPKIDFETAEKYGIDRIDELPWKTLLDGFACTECGRCNNVCPAHLTHKPLKPKKVLHDIKISLLKKNGPSLYELRDALGRRQQGTKEAEAAWTPPVALITKDEIKHEDKSKVSSDGSYLEVDGQIHVDEAWACTTCAACVEACPVLIDSVPGTLIGLRQSLVMMESDFPGELTAAFKGLERQGNPWGVGPDKREEWAEGLEVPTFASIGGERVVDYLFFVGCAGATDDNAKKTQRALVRLLKAAKVDFAILGAEEKCCGDPARRLGNEAVFNQLAQENIGIFGQYKFKKMFTACPHCLTSIQNEYAEHGGDFEVLHHSQLISQLLKDKRIPLDAAKALASDVTYHDPCYLGRYCRETEAPRGALVTITGKDSGGKSKLVEMERNRGASFCCGGGGGRIFLEEHIGERVNVERTKQAMATGAKTIATACPFCKSMLVDGTKALDAEEKISVKDIAELLADGLPAR